MASFLRYATSKVTKARQAMDTLAYPIVQVAYFVTDAQAAARHAATLYGAGPFFFVPKIELAWGELRGQPQKFLHSSAYGQWGEIMLEFVQQDEEGPSPFREMFAPGREGGVHHMATMVESMSTAYDHFATQGLEVAARAETLTGTEFAFIDTVARQGHMLEIYEKSPSLLGFYDLVKDAASGWKGENPVRTLG